MKPTKVESALRMSTSNGNISIFIRNLAETDYDSLLENLDREKKKQVLERLVATVAGSLCATSVTCRYVCQTKRR